MSTALALSGPASFVAADGVRAIIPATFQSVWEMADLLSKSGMTPKGIETREQVAVALFHGLEVGLTPMASLQSIAVINGRPAIWGDGALGLIRSNALCEGVREWTENKGTEQEVAYCEVKRRGGEVIRREFSYADAKAANLLNKDGPWKLYRSRMMQMRARAFALRDGFADVLRGLAIAEEVQDIPAVRDVSEAPVPPGAAPKPAAERAPAREVQGEIIEPERKPKPAETAPEPERAAEKKDDAPKPPSGNQATPADEFRAYVDKLEKDCAAAQTIPELQKVWAERDRSFDGPETNALLTEIRDRHKARVTPAATNEVPRSTDKPGEGFDEEAYRSEFLQRLAAATKGEEALALMDEANAKVEAGVLSTSDFEAHYEDALSTAIERLP